MSIRHRAIKAILEPGYASEWNDDHYTDFTVRVEHGLFNFMQTLATTYDTAQTSGGVAPTFQLVGVAGSGHVVAVLNTGATTGQSSSMRAKLQGAHSNITSPADLPVLNMSVELSAYHTTGTVAEWGLCANATSPFTANQSGAYFRVVANVLYTVTGTGAAETATSIGAPAQYAAYRIVVNSVNTQFYVDDMETPVSTHTTNLPAVDLNVKASIISVNNVDSTMRVDGVALSMLRAA